MVLLVCPLLEVCPLSECRGFTVAHSEQLSIGGGGSELFKSYWAYNWYVLLGQIGRHLGEGV